MSAGLETAVVAPEPQREAALPTTARLTTRAVTTLTRGRRMLGRRWVREALIFLTAYLLYELARTLGTGSRSAAVANGHRVLALERWAGLDL